jgi:hypothetical protein
MGFQMPYEGDAYAGISAYVKQNPEAREYLSAELLNVLETGIRYAVTFYVSAANRVQYAVSTLGAALTPELPSVITVDWPDGMLDAEPQVLLNTRISIIDTAKWVLISDTIVANGGERYLSIGNFHLDGESDTLRFNPNQPPIYGSPTTFAYYYIDDVSVIALDSVPSGVGIAEHEALDFDVWPNPAEDVLRFRVVAGSSHSTGSGQATSLRVRVLDAVGRVVWNKTLKQVQGDSSIDVRGLPTGIYFLELTDIEGSKAIRKFVRE